MKPVYFLSFLLFFSLTLFSGCRKACADKRDAHLAACQAFVANPSPENEAVLLAIEEDLQDSECAPSGCLRCEGYHKRVLIACDSLAINPTAANAQIYYDAVSRYEHKRCNMKDLAPCNP